MIYTRIVAATDFSETAVYAVARAAMLASEHGAALELVHVIPRGALDELRWIASPRSLGGKLCAQVRENLEALVLSMGASAPVSTHVEVGSVVERIAAHAGSDALLVMGARGEGFLRDLLLGSTAERLLGRGGGPILVVKAAPAKSYARVLAGLDLKGGARQVLEAAIHISPTATLTVAHAYDLPFEGMLQRAGVGRSEIDSHRGDALRKALQEIETLARGVAPAPHRVLPLAERGHPAKVLLERAASVDADLIVLGRRRRTAAERLLVGSVARHVIAGAASDVLVVPQLAEVRA